MHIRKSTGQLIAAAFALLAVIGILIAFNRPALPAHAAGQSIGCVDLTRGSGGTSVTTNGCIGNGTTTPVFLTAAAATTTLTVPTANATSISLNLDVIASSSSAIYTFAVQYSNNGTDWYTEDSSAVSGAVTTHAAVGVLHLWTPGATAETRRSLNIQTHQAKFTRFGFQAVTANGSIYAQAIPRNEIPN